MSHATGRSNRLSISFVNDQLRARKDRHRIVNGVYE